MLRNAQVANTRLRDYAYLIVKLVHELVSVLHTMSSVVRVECYGQSQCVVPANNLQLLHNLHFQSCYSIWLQVAQLYRHWLLFLCRTLSHNCSVAWGNRIFILLFCLLFLNDLCFNNFIVNDCLKFGEKRGFLQRENVSALKRIILIWITICEFHIRDGCCTSQLALDIDFRERQEKFVLLLFCIEKELAATFFVLTGLW